jgi:uncharacterized protein with HEPN domain
MAWLDDVDLDDLMKVVLVLAAIWLALEIFGWAASSLTRSIRPVVVLVLVLVLLWYYDRI